jgi:carbon-monoxide dehydrogenase large subunit
MSDGEKFKGRREDPRFLTGQGRYTNDWHLPGEAHACFRRSEQAHAVIKKVDTQAAPTGAMPLSRAWT